VNILQIDVKFPLNKFTTYDLYSLKNIFNSSIFIEKILNSTIIISKLWPFGARGWLSQLRIRLPISAQVVIPGQ